MSKNYNPHHASQITIYSHKSNNWKSQPSNIIYIANIPSEIQTNDFKEQLQHNGQIWSIYRDKDLGTCRVQYASVEQAQRALKQFQSNQHSLKHNQIKGTFLYADYVLNRQKRCIGLLKKVQDKNLNLKTKTQSQFQNNQKPIQKKSMSNNYMRQ